MPARSPRSAFRFVAAGVVAGAMFASAGPAASEETVDSTSPTARPTSAGGEVGHPNKLRLTKAAGAGTAASQREAARQEKEAAAPDPAAVLAAELHKAGPGAEDQAVATVKKLGELGTPRAMDVLLDELSLGLSPKVAKAALDVLAARRDSDTNTFPVLSLYAHHRNPELRKQALTALAALMPPAPGAAPAGAATPGAATGKVPAKPAAKAPPKPLVPPPVMPAAVGAGPVVPLLIAALSDANAEVRAVAAQALGDHREKSAEPYLIKLLLRKDAAAPVALGQIGGPDTARALAEMIGNVPDGMILETLGELLKRPDFGPEPVRVQVVKTIGKMPGAVTLDILGDYVKESAKDKARPSRVEAQKIIEQRTAK